MPSCLVFFDTAKRLAQKLLGHGDVRGFVRKQQLWLSKKIHRRPIAVAELWQRLTDLGVTPGRTLWVQSSWNEFFNVPMRPSEVIELLRDMLGPDGTLAMPAFPIDQDPAKVFLVDRHRCIRACCARFSAAPPASSAASISARRSARSVLTRIF